MERTSDIWKKYPLLLLGELPAIPAGTPSLELASIGSEGSLNINDFYIVVALRSLALEEALASLEKARVSPDQILIFLPAENAFSHKSHAYFGLLDQQDCESTEELRGRLLSKLESQRQKKLLTALREAQEGGIVRRLSEPDLARALDVTRIAHALSCGYGLSPAMHGKILQDCLSMPSGGPSAWIGEIPAERLIPEASAFLVETMSQGGSLREAIRERAATLSFRTRTELLHQIGNCLGAALGGKSAA